MTLFSDTAARVGSSGKEFAGGFTGKVEQIGGDVFQGAKGQVERIAENLGLIEKTGGGVLADKEIVQDTFSWGALSPLLMARIQPCDISGKIDEKWLPVIAPVNEFNMDINLQWQSPFENAGAESKAPALMALIQSGQSVVYMNALQGLLGAASEKATGVPVVGDALKSITATAGKVAGKAAELAADLTGRTGITKLNSRQVFSGMPPVKFTMNLHFKAIENGFEEVMVPYHDILRWSLPVSLAKNGALISLYENVKGGGEIIKAMFPSISPTCVALTYAGETFAPLVIEAVGAPMDGPKDIDGKPIYKVVNMQLSSLEALDRNDVTAFFK